MHRGNLATLLQGATVHLCLGLRRHKEVLLRRLARHMGMPAPADGEVEFEGGGRGARQRGLGLIGPARTCPNAAASMPVLPPVCTYCLLCPCTRYAAWALQQRRQGASGL